VDHLVCTPDAVMLFTCFLNVFPKAQYVVSVLPSYMHKSQGSVLQLLRSGGY
jgi:hypothetical protein